MYGDFRIKNYLMLRFDFEKYIQKNHNKAVVRWNDYSEVSAYIISLEEYPQKSKSKLSYICEWIKSKFLKKQ